jgi:hypothetical protein
MENMQSQSDDTPLYSKNDIREIRLLMKEYMDENEELRAKIIAMNQYVGKSESSLKKAKMYISQLEYTLADITTPSKN